MIFRHMYCSAYPVNPDSRWGYRIFSTKLLKKSYASRIEATIIVIDYTIIVREEEDFADIYLYNKIINSELL